MAVPSIHKDSSRPSAPSHQGHIPAWKRLGLKLKKPNDYEHIVSSINGLPHGTSTGASPDSDLVPPAGESAAEQPAKRRRVEIHADTSTPRKGKLAEPSATLPKDQSGRLKKKVSFTAETKVEDGGKELIMGWEQDDYAYYEQKAAENDAKEAQAKSEKSSILPPKPSSTPRKSRDALEYLNLYHTSRSSWKFNKNREVWILRHILSTDEIPTSFNFALASYVDGLGSNQARSRLLHQCRAALEKEGPKSSAGDEHGSDSSDRMAQIRQKGSDDSAVRRFKRSLEGHFDDAQRKADEDDPQYQRWLSQRTRAELLLWALAPPTSSTEEASISNRKVRLEPQSPAGFKPTTEVPRNGVHPTGRASKRKNRTAVVEVSSSSDDESTASDDESNRSKSTNDKDILIRVTTFSSSAEQSSSAASSSDSDSV